MWALNYKKALRLAIDILELSESEAKEFLEMLSFARALLGDDIDGLWSFLSIYYDEDAVYEFLAEIGWL